MNYKKLFFWFCSPIVFLSCKEDGEGVSVINPGIATTHVTEVSIDAATLNGEILEIGNQDYTNFGFVWDTIPNVSISSPGKVTLSSIPIQGKISRKITGLKPGKTYYAKIFISNKSTSLMGEQVSFETKPQFVKSIHPAIGFFGQELKIRGAGFSPRISENKVQFVRELFNSKLDASVIAATDSVITVIIPDYPYTMSTDPYEVKINVNVNQTKLDVEQKFSFANFFTLENASAKVGANVVLTIDSFSPHGYLFYFNDIEVPIKWTWSIPNATQIGIAVPEGTNPGVVTVKVAATSNRPVLAKGNDQLTITQ